MPDDSRRIESNWNGKEVAAGLRDAFRKHRIRATVTPRTTDVKVQLWDGLREYQRTIARDLMLIHDVEPRLANRKLSGDFDWTEEIEAIRRKRGDRSLTGINNNLIAERVDVPTTLPEEGNRAVPVIVTVKPGRVRTRPDLFQPRDVPGGLDHDPAKVRQLVAHWNPDEYDPVAVTRDPSDPNAYIVIAGHHRLEALKQLGAPQFAVKVLEGDISDPVERERLRTQADLSNYAISAPGIIERVNTVRRLRTLGWEDRRIADKMRLPKFSQMEDLGYLTHMTPDVLHSIAQHKQMMPVAAEIGRGVEKYGLGEETASQLYKKIFEDFEATNKVPNRYAVRGQLAAAHLRAQTRAAQPERLAGFGEDVFTSQFSEDVKAENDRRKAYSETRRNLTSCQVLADELGVDIAEVQAAANTRLETLTPAEEKRAREVVTGVAPGPDVVAAPTKSPGTGTDDDSLFMPFGTPQPVEPMEPLSEKAQPVPVPKEREALAPACPPAQVTLGEEYHTNQPIAMPIGGEIPAFRDPITTPPPEIDPRQGGFFDEHKEDSRDHDHGTDLWGAAQCSAQCLIAAREAKGIQDAKMLEKSKSDIDIGGGYVLGDSRRAKEKPYIVKCDDCKTTMGTTDSLRESAEGGRCDKCKLSGACTVCKEQIDTRAQSEEPGDGKPMLVPKLGWFCHKDYSLLHGTASAMKKALDKPKYEQNEGTGRFQRVKYTGPATTQPDPEPSLALPAGKPKKSSTRRKGKRPSIITVSKAQISYWKPRKRK